MRALINSTTTCSSIQQFVLSTFTRINKQDCGLKRIFSSSVIENATLRYFKYFRLCLLATMICFGESMLNLCVSHLLSQKGAILNLHPTYQPLATSAIPCKELQWMGLES